MLEKSPCLNSLTCYYEEGAYKYFVVYRTSVLKTNTKKPNVRP